MRPILLVILFLSAGTLSAANVAETKCDLETAIDQARVRLARSHLVCIEHLGHKAARGKYLRRLVSVPAPDGEVYEIQDFLQWAAANRLRHSVSHGVVLLVDGDIDEINDNPFDVEIPPMEVALPAEGILAHFSKLSDVGILAIYRAGRFSRDPLHFRTEIPMKLRDALCLFSQLTGVEWIAEVCPPSRTTKAESPDVIVLAGPKGTIELKIAN